MRIASRRLGEFLVDRHVLSRDALEDLLAREAEEGVHLSHLLVRERLVGEQDLMAAVASELGVPFVDLSEHSILPDVWGLVPEDLARGYLAVAIERRPDGVVVAMEDPSDEQVVAALEVDLKAPVLPAVAVRTDLESVIDQVYGAETPEDDDLDWDDRRSERPARRSASRARRLRLDDLLRKVVSLGASDLHLTVGAPPGVRVVGSLRTLEGEPSLIGSDIRSLMYGILTRRQRARFEQSGELSTSYSLAGVGRFRMSLFVQRDSMGAVLRSVPFEVPALESLNLPAVVERLPELRSGLVLVNGARGSGTSTTLAALIDRINRTRAGHILTIENPIEFLHRHDQSLVNQREVGEDTESFATGLRQAMLLDADVLLVGELPDLETIRLALAAAETGKLVLATVRARNAVGSIERLINVFPVDQQRFIRVQLATVLRAIIVQQFLPGVEGQRVVAAEVLVGTTEVRDAILADDMVAISALQNARLDDGMQPMDRFLADLVRAGRIAEATAREHAVDADEVSWLLSGGHD